MITPIKATTVGTNTTFTYVGKSTDEKPMSTNGSTFKELDTGREYFFDGDEQGWSTQSDKYLVSIEVTTAPTKVAYVVGQEFDATGMVVKATYTDSESASTVTTYTVEASDPLTIDDTSVTIKYVENGRTRTTTQAITVEPVALSSIAFTTNPTKTTYADGDALDLTGAVVTATYNNNDTAIVTEACEFTPADGATLATTDTAVTASYTEGEVTKTANVSITVS